MIFYAPQDQKHLKKEREKARELKKSAWWNQKVQCGICYYCEKKFSKDFLTMDHKVPLAKGGTSSKNNIVCCCKECNSLKQSKTSVDFISS